MDFSQALDDLRGGAAVARTGWNGRGQYLMLLDPTPEDYVTRPYIAIKAANGDIVPWVASQSDLLADDWGTVDD